MIGVVALVLALVALLGAVVAIVLVVPTHSRVWKLHTWATQHSQWCEGQLVPGLQQTIKDFNKELKARVQGWPEPGPGGGGNVPPKDTDYP